MIIYRLLSHSKLKQLCSTEKEIIYPKIGNHTKRNITQFSVKMSPHMYEVVKMPATANTTVLFATTKKTGDSICTIVYLQAGAFLAAACLVVADRVTG